MKKNNPLLILLITVTFFSTLNVCAQTKWKLLRIKDLEKAIGTWRGTLTYLDYSSGKPYTMPADLIVSFIDEKKGLVRVFEYPDEPKANSKDTLQLQKDGLFLNEAKIVSNEIEPTGNFTLVTEYNSVDGNDNKKAIIRNTYTLKNNSLSMKKDVQFIGTNNWIKRHEYQFTKEVKVAETNEALFNKIAALDSAMFAAFNAKDMPTFKNYFTTDLEWFQDNGGLLNYETVFTNFQNMFKNENRLIRNFVKGSLEVHTLKDYGAIEIGKHQFKHMENGKLEIGTFKFLMIWKNDKGNWRISRVISYDH
jgi:ketosteroid isomerase-like protein